MQTKWSKSAKNSLQQIKSVHFSKEERGETKQFKVQLVSEVGRQR